MGFLLIILRSPLVCIDEKWLKTLNDDELIFFGIWLFYCFEEQSSYHIICYLLWNYKIVMNKKVMKFTTIYQ